MSVSQKFKLDSHIGARREMEAREAAIMNKIRADKNNQLKAAWEIKSEEKITKNIVRDRIADMKKRAATDLN